MSSDTRLIERWLPIAALGEESVRERRSMTALPPTYYLHVWWARKPLVASRAAVLASLLPADADHDKFLHAVGIHGDPVKARKRIELAKRSGADLGLNPYGYNRAFQWTPDADDVSWIAAARRDGEIPVVLDPTAGGGSIPFESVRLGLRTMANDLNPVAALILFATVTAPARHGIALKYEFDALADRFLKAALPKYDGVFPDEPQNAQVLGYLYARTITCPYCEGLVPLSPNWKLSSDGTGVRLRPNTSGARTCKFEIVSRVVSQSTATIADGNARCPFPGCDRVIDGDEIKRQACAGEMGEQLYAVVFKHAVVVGHTKGGKEKLKWERAFRAPREEDDNSRAIKERLASKIQEWETLDLIPSEGFPEKTNYDRGHRMYGVRRWIEMFSPRQLLCHGLSVETYREILAEDEANNTLSDIRRAAYVYLALSLDKFRDYNSRMTRWISQREVLANTFDQHNFAFKWSYAEMAPMVVGRGYDWVIGQVSKCVGELCSLVRPEEPGDRKRSGSMLLDLTAQTTIVPATVTCKSAESLIHLKDRSIDVVVMDPPYYDNVMYAELSDFFYVWLKRTAGHVMPDLFTRVLTDKDNEAIANPAKFAGEKSPKGLAGRDYQERMATIFAECRRVLKSNGVMTVMFTHKATGAWDSLTKSLMNAGFSITASWPVNTENETSLHIKDKAAATSTIFLVCRPRIEPATGDGPSYWEDVEPLVSGAVRERMNEFQDAGISGVDLYLASFGPALQKFSEHWPLRRGAPRAQPEVRKRKKQAEMFEEEWDPYEVTPEDALDAARREVKRWRLQQLTHMKARTDLDPLTSFYVLAWDAFKAPRFDYDEALRLGRAVGVDLEKDIIGHVAEKKGSEIMLWDSAKRAAKGSLGPADGSRSWLDAVHHAAYAARSRNLQHALEMLQKAQVDTEQRFFAALEAVLEVLPVSQSFSGIDLEGDVKEFGGDFEALENLRKLAFANDVDEPQQLQLWKEEPEAAGVSLTKGK